jgi:hypothetical protein
MKQDEPMLMHTTILRRSLYTLLLAACLALLAGCAAPFEPERNYLSNVFDHMRRTVSTLNELQILASNPRLDDPAWRQQATTELEQLNQLINEADAMDPPPRLADLHRAYLDAIGSLRQITDLYNRAIELRDMVPLQQAEQMIEQQSETIESLREQMDQLEQQPQE